MPATIQKDRKQNQNTKKITIYADSRVLKKASPNKQY